jgi:hypothetical protein
MKSMINRRLTAAIAAVLCAAAPGALAHEFWLMPHAFGIQAGELLRVRTLHGERLDGQTVPRNNAAVARFELVDDTGATPVRGVDGGPESFVRPAGTGPAVLVYESTEFVNILPAERFDAYLTEEGLTDALRDRQTRGEQATPGREVYVRCAKSLIAVGPAPTPEPGVTEPTRPADRVVGLPLELVLEPTENPGPDEPTVTVRALFNGLPIEGLRVVAASAASPSDLQSTATDHAGIARFEGRDAGTWLITALHIERTAGRADCDWKSYWASLSFVRSDRN